MSALSYSTTLRQTEGSQRRIQLWQNELGSYGRNQQRRMGDGVTVADPATTSVDASVDLATDVVSLPGTPLEGATSVGVGAQTGSQTRL